LLHGKHKGATISAPGRKSTRAAPPDSPERRAKQDSGGQLFKRTYSEADGRSRGVKDAHEKHQQHTVGALERDPIGKNVDM